MKLPILRRSNITLVAFLQNNEMLHAPIATFSIEKLLLTTTLRSDRPLWRDQIMCPRLQLRKATTSYFRPATNFLGPNLPHYEQPKTTTIENLRDYYTTSTVSNFVWDTLSARCNFDTSI